MGRRRGLAFLLLGGLASYALFDEPGVSDVAALPVEVASISLSSSAAPALVATGPKLEVFLADRFVTASSLRLRAKPGPDGEVLAFIPKGSRVAVRGGRTGWLKIVDPLGREGWASAKYLSETAAIPEPAQRAALVATAPDREAIAQRIIERSIASYSGSCPCPYNADRAGRSCGGRSAYSRPGGAELICYVGDVTDAMIYGYR